MPVNRRDFLAATAAATAALPWQSALTQTAPDVARIILGFPGGSTPDVLARKVGERLSKSYAKSVLVDNRTGAGGQLAASGVKSAAPDGSTILLTPMSILGVFPFTYKQLPYDPVADFTPVSNGVTFDYGIGVGPAVPESVKTINDLMAWYKANPTQANMGSPSTGSTLHFVTMMLGRAAGGKLTHVGYKGSAPAIQDMLGGNLPALCTPLGSFLNQPKLRVLATSGAKRSPFTPNVPTLAEQGFKDLVYDEWYGFFLPAKAAPETVKKLNAALHEALADKDVIDTLATFGMEVTPSSPGELAASLKDALAKWGPIVKSIGFSADA
ncbi:MAG: Bug family tripartite tricarboxylate transporter substrate binding protein [Burkholderiaceae bacterium]|jgi:tripartite-type tricarboxylate transporter receptor subunit TctC|nr:Bug family tripartite tricarboxylate transporter substrate binding protein [Burkholderiaceae bacterium]